MGSWVSISIQSFQAYADTELINIIEQQSQRLHSCGRLMLVWDKRLNPLYYFYSVAQRGQYFFVRFSLGFCCPGFSETTWPRFSWAERVFLAEVFFLRYSFWHSAGFFSRISFSSFSTVWLGMTGFLKSSSRLTNSGQAGSTEMAIWDIVRFLVICLCDWNCLAFIFSGSSNERRRFYLLQLRA